MKKLLSSLLSVCLILGISTSAFAAKEDSDVTKAMELITKTNNEIAEKILKAQKEADDLRDDYLSKIHKLNESRFQEVNKVNTLVNEENQTKEIETILNNIEEEIIKVQETENTDHLSVVEEEVIELNEILAPTIDTYTLWAQEQVQKETKGKYEKLNKKYVEQLDKIISKLYDETLKMSQRTIKKVGKAGIIAECFWVFVKIGDIEVWIDPIAVVGEN